MTGRKAFDEALDRAAHEAARLDDKSSAQVAATLKYSFVSVAVAAAMFSMSVYGLNHAKTNAGAGVGWFASAITGLFLAGFAWSTVGIWLELRRRRRAGSIAAG